MKMLGGLVLTLLFISSTIADIPGCDYFDTVDLTESKKFPNGSYLYEHLIIPADQTAEYDYEILVDGEKEDVPKHLRGCACKLGTCIRFCCHHNLRLAQGERKCIGDIAKAADFDPYVNITLNNGNVVSRHVLDDFIVQRHLPVPCAARFHLDNNIEEEAWTLFENGSLFRHFDNQTLTKQEYCLQPHGEENGTLTLVPHNCATIENLWLENTLWVLTIICLILTIFVYLWLPKLRNLQSYCFICYMLCLIVAYAMLLHDAWKESLTLCSTAGYVGYFSVMAGFFWLTVISYDLWNSFRGNNYNVQRYIPRNRFFMYSLYAWGIAAILTIIVIILDKILEDEVSWMPGIGYYNCWIKTDDWSAMIYFYGPMSLQIIFNVTMFVLTIFRILEVQKELQNNAIREERETRLNSDKQTFSLFVRLFVIMGVAWIFEILAYLGADNAFWKNIFVIFDYINCAQGVIIFILFVLKPSVLRLILDRIRGIETVVDDGGSEEEIALQDRNGKKIGPSILN